MKRLLLLFILFPLLNFSQTQIGQDIDGESVGDQSGRSISVSLDGTILAIGAITNNGNGSRSGHVRVYEYNGVDWNQIGQDIDGESAVDQSGSSVSISLDGTILAIGAINNDGNGSNSGHVRVYEFNSITNLWEQVGQDIDGEAVDDQSGFGVSLSSDGSIVGIGAPSNDGNGFSSGHVRVYEFSTTTNLWEQIGQDIDGESDPDFSGQSVSLSSDGSIIGIGASRNDGNGNDSGHVRVYEYNGINWIQVGLDIDGEASGDQSGTSISLSSNGSIVAIGAPRNNGNGSSSGHVRVYEYNGTSWIQIG